MITILAVVVTVLFFTSQKRQSQPHDARNIKSFFGKTMDGLDQRRGVGGQVVMSGKGSAPDENLKDHDGDGSVDEDDEKLAQQMAERLRAAEQQAKDQANAKSPLKPDAPSEVVGVGSSANGQKKGKYRISKHDTEDEKEGEGEADGSSEVEVTLRQILTKSPGTYLRMSMRQRQRGTHAPCFLSNLLIQLLSSQSRTALTRKRRRASCSRNTS